MKCVCAWLFLMLAIMTLAACSTTHSNLMQGKGHQLSRERFERRHAIAESLAAKFIQATQVGEQVRVILPTDPLFYPNSSRLRESAYRQLNKVISFLGTYDTEVIDIAGYTDDSCTLKRNQALSQMRARHVADYLWERVTNVRILQTAGRANCHVIASNTSSSGRAINRRIEITTWDVAG